MSTGKPLVGIIMGSDSDLPVMTETVKVLQKFGIGFELEVASAHRSPNRMHEFASTAADRGLKVIIAAAGGAAHLAGVVAAFTTLPVVAVPLTSTSLNGLDALLSTVQMPPGVPVATMALDKWGATNAGIFAVQILAAADAGLRQGLADFKRELAQSVAEKNARAQAQFK
jgi:phosphoribosylaminoimidazole carboxylase PurE protein